MVSWNLPTDLGRVILDLDSSPRGSQSLGNWEPDKWPMRLTRNLSNERWAPTAGAQLWTKEQRGPLLWIK
ncbi:hypothetical protein B296_00029115, partial [Ensete ventricosum]